MKFPIAPGHRMVLGLVALIGAALLSAVACGGSDATPTTSGQSPTQTTVAGAQPTTTANAPTEQSGTLNIAVRSLGAGPWIQRNGHPSELATQLGISEGFFMPGGPGNSEDVGMLVDSWELASDLSKVTLRLRHGVEFHAGWGEMTADDVVYSVNDANATTSPTSIQAQAGDLAAMFKEWKKVDDYTVDAPFATFDSTWQRGLLNVWYQSVDVLSKKVYDDLGADKAAETLVATGPFQATTWLQHDRVEAVAVKDHWRSTPKIAGFLVREVPEESARIAALKTGEIDIGEIRVLRNVEDLKNSGISITEATQEAQQDAIIFGGNLWEKTSARDGSTLDRPGFKPDAQHPWIGNPDDPAQMEKARQVRWAMAMAIDRQAIVDTVLGGLGAPNYLPWFSVNNEKLWKDDWKVDFDPDAAKQMLADAGYGSGFDVVLYDTQIYGPAEVSKAVAGMWRDYLGLSVTVDLSDYSSAFRPTVVDRSVDRPWMSGCDEGRNLPADWPRGAKSTSLLRGGFGCNEIPEYVDWFHESSQEPDAQKRIAINQELGDFAYHWMDKAGTVEVPGIWAFNPERVDRWDLRRGFKNTLNSLDTVVLKK